MIESSTASANTAVILLPSDRFFVRTVSLASDTDIPGQITLAVEGLAPFPLSQLYYGWLQAETGDVALVFAAYRKRFSNEETTAWNSATAVLPAFLALLGEAPSAPTIRLMAEAHGITAAAWDGSGTLPVAVVARELESPVDAAQRAALVAEIRQRTGLIGAAASEYGSLAKVNPPGGREVVSLELADDSRTLITSLSQRAIGGADVRDKDFLTARHTQLKRDLLLWRGFAAFVGGLAAMLLLEAGLFAGDQWLKSLKDTVQQQAPAVLRIETAQTLSTRIEEMTRRRLMPFEMLAFVNQNRPASIQFIRATTMGFYSLEIEAQTANAADVGQYEAVLRAATELTGIETRDLRSRDGLTTFIFTVTFKPESLHWEAGT